MTNEVLYWIIPVVVPLTTAAVLITFVIVCEYLSQRKERKRIDKIINRN